VRVMVRSRRISIEQLVILLVVPVAGVLAGATLLVGGRALVANFAQIGIATLLVFVFLGLWQNGLRFLRWMIFARRIGIPIKLGEGLLFYLAGCGMTLTPGRVGEMLRLWFIEKRFGTPYRRSGALYVADRVGDADAYLVMLALSVALLDVAPSLTWGVIGGVVSINLCLLFPHPVLGALRLAYRLTPRCRKFLVWLRRIVRNTATLFRPSLFLPCLALGIIGWGAAPVALALALNRMGVELGLPAAMMICAIASLTGGATMLPGGGGGTEAAMVLLLRTADVPLDAAVAATIATRTAFFWLPICGGLLALPIAIRSVRRVEQSAAVHLVNPYPGGPV